MLGREGSLPLLELYRAEALFVTDDREIAVTKGLERAFTLTGEGYRLEETP